MPSQTPESMTGVKLLKHQSDSSRVKPFAENVNLVNIGLSLKIRLRSNRVNDQSHAITATETAVPMLFIFDEKIRDRHKKRNQTLDTQKSK